MLGMYKKVMVVLIFVMILLGLSGCSINQIIEKKDTITVYLSEASLLKSYAPYIQEQFPDVDIQFTVGRDTIDFLEFKQKNEDLPDIIMTGQLSLRESLDLNSYLLDLSQTEVAASFYTTYLETQRCEDGSIRWLPSGGIIHGILANKDLFDKYGISLPTDYASFVATCEAFEEHGIRGFVSDYKYGYTCMYTLEGWSIPELMSQKGTSWRYNYENSLTNELDKELWLGAFERLETFIEDVGVLPEDVKRGYTMTKKDLAADKVAMIRGTSSDIKRYSKICNIILLPYFGQTEQDTWLYTSPRFHVALNGKLANDTDKQELALQVLEVMLSTEGMSMLSEEYLYNVPYNREYSGDIPEELKNIESLILSNRLYISQASPGIQTAAKKAVQQFIKGEADVAEAYEIMNKMIMLANTEKQEFETVATLETAYSAKFHKSKGNAAASAILNTLRKVAGTDFLLAPASICTGSLYACDYTETQLDNAFQSSGNRLYTYDLTGAEIRELVRLSVEGYGTLNDPFSKETLPIVSGLKISVEAAEDGYLLKDITVDGKPLADDKIYTLGIADNPARVEPLVDLALGEGIFEQFTSSGDTYARDLWVEYIKSGNQPEPATPYIELE